MTGVRSGSESDSLEGHYAGPVTRLLAYAADGFISVTLYGVVLSAFVLVGNAIVEGEVTPPSENTVVWGIGLAVWLFLYNAVSWSVWWKTPGKALLGLRVVERDGANLRPRTAWLRAIVYPVSFIVAGLGLVGIVIGRERRALHDVLAGTTVVYDWNARTARWRLMARRHGPVPEEEG